MSWQPYSSETARFHLFEQAFRARSKKAEALAVGCLIEAVICRDDLRRNPGDKLAAKWLRIYARCYVGQLRVLRLTPTAARRQLLGSSSLSAAA